MSTDLDDRLREAGRRYRDTHTRPADLDAAALRDPRPRGARRIELAAVAAAVVIIVAGLAAAIAGRGSTTTGSGDGGHATVRATPRTAAVPAIYGTWYLRYIRTVNGSTIPYSGTAVPYLRLRPDGTFMSSDGCNGVSSSLAVRDTTLVFGSGAQTKMACGDLQGQLLIDRTFAAGQASWTSSDGQLIIKRDGAVLTFQRTGVPNPLAGTRWGLSSWDIGGRHYDVALARTLALHFAANNMWSFTDVCSQGSGRVDVAPGTLVSHGFGGTMVGCTDTGGLQETINVVLGPGTSRWQIDGDRLTITRGDRTLTYDRA